MSSMSRKREGFRTYYGSVVQKGTSPARVDEASVLSKERRVPRIALRKPIVHVGAQGGAN